MKKTTIKKIQLLTLVLLVSLCFLGCSIMDSVFYKAPGVSANDLADFTGTAANTETEATSGVAAGVLTVVGCGMAVAQEEGSSKEFDTGMEILKMASPLLAEQLKTDDSRTITFTIEDNSYPMSIDFSAVNETYSVYGGELNLADVSFNASVNVDNADNPSEMNYNFDSKATITATDLLYATDMTVDELILNFLGKGNATMTSSSVDYYAAIDMNLGFSLSDNTGAGMSGKYIVALNYVQSGAVTDFSLADPTEILGDLSFTLSIKVYDNNNTETFSADFNQTDIQEYYTTLYSK